MLVADHESPCIISVRFTDHTKTKGQGQNELYSAVTATFWHLALLTDDSSLNLSGVKIKNAKASELINNAKAKSCKELF